MSRRFLNTNCQFHNNFFTPSFTIMAKWYHHHPIRPKKITFSFTQASQTFNMATLDKCHISILVKLTWSVIISVYTPILLILWSDIQLQQPKNPKWIIFNFCWQTLLQISNDPSCYAGFTTEMPFLSFYMNFIDVCSTKTVVLVLPIRTPTQTCQDRAKMQLNLFTHVYSSINCPQPLLYARRQWFIAENDQMKTQKHSAEMIYRFSLEC
jgi:hypothetical protein